MATTVYFRGSTIHFETTFYDRNNLITNPPSAQLYVSHRQSGSTTFITDSPITMTQNGNLWSADWESKTIPAGDVDWCIRTGQTPYIVDQGNFTLQANNANPAT